MVDVRQLRYFVAIADQHSISLASEKLGIAQPSLSHHVMRIEEELGVQLLVRSTRGDTLTILDEHLTHLSPIDDIRAPAAYRRQGVITLL